MRRLLLASVLVSLCLTPAGTTLASTAGQSLPVDNHQPSLGIHHVIRLTGDPDDVGEVGFFGGNFAPRGWAFPEGQTLSPSDFPDLFNKIRTTYGGDGVTSFRLPDLRGASLMGVGSGSGLTPRVLGEVSGASMRVFTETQLPAHTHTLPQGLGDSASAGDGQSAAILQPAVTLTPIIATTGLFPSRASRSNATVGSGPSPISSGKSSPFLGELAWAAGDEIPAGWAAANGELLSVSQNDALFALLGTTYGGDGRTDFGLPDLRGRFGVGEGQGSGLTPRGLGQQFGAETVTLTTSQLPSHSHNLGNGVTTGSTGGDAPHDQVQPSLGINYLIALEGVFPSRDVIAPAATAPFQEPAEIGSGDNPLLASIIPFAGNFAPRGWAFADGQLLPIAQNPALFSILGTSFGGDGRQTFGLPDLRGRTLVHPDSGIGRGSEFGSESATLTLAQLATHTHNFDLLLGDYNADGIVNAADYAVWRDALTTGNLAADGDNNGVVDGNDFTLWVNQFGEAAAPDATAVPEPAAWSLAAALLLGLVKRR